MRLTGPYRQVCFDADTPVQNSLGIWCRKGELGLSPLASCGLVLLDCVAELVFFGTGEDLEVLCVKVETEPEIWNTEEDALTVSFSITVNLSTYVTPTAQWGLCFMSCSGAPGNVGKSRKMTSAEYKLHFIRGGLTWNTDCVFTGFCRTGD